MKKKILFGIGLFSLMALLVLNCTLLNITSSKEISLSLIHKIAQAEAESGAGGGGERLVPCRCGLLWGSGCRANNYGCWCAPESATFCSIYDGNCG